MNSVLEALKSNPFGAASLFIAITVLIVFQWWRQRKVFSCTVVSHYPLVDVSKNFSQRVKILFDDKQVDKVSLIVIELRNNGWVPIEDKDFYEPVAMNFGESAEIMSIETVESRPKTLKANTVWQGACLTLEPLLLNRGDRIKLKLLVHNFKPPVSVSGRIKGIPAIEESPMFGTGPVLVMCLLGIILFYQVYGIFKLTLWSPLDILLTLVLYLTYLVGVYIFLKKARPINLRIYDD